MAEFVRVFQSGKMNKDLDERLVPNGEYRDALNLDLASPDASDGGALQNIKGNSELRLKTSSGSDESWAAGYISDLPNAECIGTYRDDANEKIYWFIASDTTSAIAEYDQTSNTVSPILVDTQNILKFSTGYRITGINVIEKFLFWTDDQTEPKKINIDKFKIGSINFVTQTKIPLWIPSQNTYSTNLAGQPNFTEADVTVIKKSPLSALTLNMSSSLFGVDQPGTGITPVSTTYTASGSTGTLENFTYVPDVLTAPGDTESLPTFGTWSDNVALDPNFYADSNLPVGYDGTNQIIISQLVPAWAQEPNSIIILSGSYTNEYNDVFNYNIRALIVSISNTTVTIKILSITNEIQIFAAPVIWDCLIVEKEPLFEYVFPRFAYRWKYIDNEYSCFSPFTDVAFIGGKFEYLSSDGHNAGMVNNIRKLIIENINWGSEEVSEVDLLYKESNSQTVYAVETLKRADYTVDGILTTVFEIENEILGGVIEANQILRPWDNVPRAAKSQEITGNRLVYGNYLQNYDVGSVSLNTAAFSQPHPNSNGDSTVNLPISSVKSLRTYQAGVVFKDDYGRETPVFTNKTAAVTFPIVNSSSVNKLSITPTGDAPSWASSYKVFIKEGATEYYNIALDRYYNSDDGNVWLSFPSSERNKVDEETYLILKKQHASSKSVDVLYKYKVLAINNEAPSFIKINNKSIGRSEVTILNDSQPQLDSIFFKFNGPIINSNPNFRDGFNSNSSLRISTDNFSTKTYKIASGGPTGTNNEYSVQLSEPLGKEALWLNNKREGDKIIITLFAQEIQDLPEFAGRFFVKINRDFGFDTNIIDTFPIQETDYAIKNSFTVLREKPQGNGDNSQDAVWYDEGSTNGVSSRRQPHGDVCPWKYPGECADNTKFTVMMQGLLHADRDDPTKWLGGLLAAIDKVGTIIRFADAKGAYGKPYVIKATTRAFKRRGMQHLNKNYGKFPNGRNQWDIELEEPYSDQDLFTGRLGTNPITEIQILEKVQKDGNKTLSTNNPAIFETEPKKGVDLDFYYEASSTFDIADYNTTKVIEWFNVFAFGNGVESNRIRDDYNEVTIDKGVKVSTVLDEPYAAERRGNGMIFSQIYNSTSGVNRLNQFIQALPITKELNPIYGTIQKLHSRDTDLISLCEDKCLRLLANKDALYNADGNANVTSNSNVLGQAVPYTGEFGISKNPESFASYGFRTYFTDKNRGAVIRLSRDGITNIAENGMVSFFADNLRTSTTAIGSYDDKKDSYNLTLNNLSPYWQSKLSGDANYQLNENCSTASTPVLNTTVSFKESVRGWASRKDFIKEGGITLNNIYYTFKNGLLWQHGSNSLYNNFYGVQYISSVNAILNEVPQAVKGFSTLNYTGTQSRVVEYQNNSKWYSIAEVNANQLIPTATQQKKAGWFVNYIKTDLEGGEIKEFQKKEGKYFNYIKPLSVFNNCEVIGAGVGSPIGSSGDPQNYFLTVDITNDCVAPLA